MGAFEEIAILDLKFRVIVVVAVLTFIIVAFPVLTVFHSEIGFVIGALAAVVTAYLTAKWLS